MRSSTEDGSTKYTPVVTPNPSLTRRSGLDRCEQICRWSPAEPYRRYRGKTVWCALHQHHLGRLVDPKWAEPEQILSPLATALEQVLTTRDYLHTDETTLQVLNEAGRTAQQKSYIWNRVTGGKEAPIVHMHYSPSRASGCQ